MLRPALQSKRSLLGFRSSYRGVEGPDGQVVSIGQLTEVSRDAVRSLRIREQTGLAVEGREVGCCAKYSV